MKKGNLYILDYFQKIKTLADSLVVAAQPIPEPDLILHILGGLPTEYDSFATSVITQSNNIFLEDLHAMVQNQEVCLNQHASLFFTHELQVTVANITPQFNNRGRELGYEQRRGREGSSRMPNQNGVKSSVVCQLCKQPNHQVA